MYFVSLTFLGHLIDENGIQADPEKTTAIVRMKAPTHITELRRFLGMANQMGKFSPNLANLTQPLRELLSKKNSWYWSSHHDQAFDQVKMELTRPTVLTMYDLEAETKVSADASSFGLGAVLLQRHEGEGMWKPIAYASRSMTETEGRYAQIEKEALAVTWACEKFVTYILGKEIVIETDHKPLVSLLGGKNLDSLPPRILRYRLRLARFQYSIIHVPGKSLCTADALSRSPVSTLENTSIQEEAETIMEDSISQLPASKSTLERFSNAQNSDPVCKRVIHYCLHGWPNKKQIEIPIIPYWKMQGELTMSKNLLLYQKRIVVPSLLQKETLQKIHAGHQGINRCRLRAQASVWWPDLSNQIKDMVTSCQICSKKFVPRCEPLLPSKLPEYPWQKIGADLFMLKGSTYLLVVDYFSRWPEVRKLSSTTSKGVIEAFKSIFSGQGIPQTLISDNGPQFSSQEFTRFSKAYNFSHITISPYFPRSNGQAERTVQTVKNLIREAEKQF